MLFQFSTLCTLICFTLPMVWAGWLGYGCRLVVLAEMVWGKVGRGGFGSEVAGSLCVCV